jgi:lipopolysaccharide export LptBFGC system permease protein LptF
MRNAGAMVLLTRSLAVVLVVVGHGFIYALGAASSVPIGAAYTASVFCLWAAAWMLWRHTME